MNIKRLLKSYLLVIACAGTFTALLFSLQYLVLTFPIFFKWVGRILLTLMLSSPFVAIAYGILKKLEE